MQNHFDCQVTEWHPQRLINGEDPMALIILNQPIGDDVKQFLKSRWKSAVFRVAVDGGLDQLKDISEPAFPFIPDLICGDFDSVMPGTLDYYKKMGVRIVPTPDQDETDFTKALKLTLNHLTEQNLQVSGILAVTQNSGRLDHIFGNLNTLHLALELTSCAVILMGQHAATWLLHKGCHEIHISEKMRDNHVGLVPLGQPCRDVSTTGLKWNLENSKMQFGGLISTSNRFEGGDMVTVRTDNSLVWTMEMVFSNV